jgi:hypothetical protein
MPPIDIINMSQVIDTIRQVHRTPVDQRAIDLSVYLTDLFRSIQAKQCDVLGNLTELLQDYDDRATLKIEFVRGQCFEMIGRLLNDSEHTIAVVMAFLLELLSNCPSNRDAFVLVNGYDKFFVHLRHLRSPSIELINRFVSLTVDKPLLSSHTSILLSVDAGLLSINPHLTVALIRWTTYLNDVTHQDYLLSAIDRIVLDSVHNKSVACSNAVARALLDLFDRDEPIDEGIALRVFSLVEHLFRFSVDVDDIRRVCRLLLGSTPYKKHLLRLLIVAVKYPDTDRQRISAYFDIQRSSDSVNKCPRQ